MLKQDSKWLKLNALHHSAYLCKIYDELCIYLTCSVPKTVMWHQDHLKYF